MQNISLRGSNYPSAGGYSVGLGGVCGCTCETVNACQPITVFKTDAPPHKSDCIVVTPDECDCGFTEIHATPTRPEFEYQDPAVENEALESTNTNSELNIDGEVSENEKRAETPHSANAEKPWFLKRLQDWFINPPTHS